MPTKGSRSVEEALFLAEKIVRARAHLAELEQRFAALVGVRNGAAPARAVRIAKAVPTDAGPGSAARRIRAYFAARPGEKVAVSDVAAALPDVDSSLIGSTIARLSRSDKRSFRRRGRGHYVYRITKGAATA